MSQYWILIILVYCETNFLSFNWLQPNTALCIIYKKILEGFEIFIRPIYLQLSWIVVMSKSLQEVVVIFTKIDDACNCSSF